MTNFYLFLFAFISLFIGFLVLTHTIVVKLDEKKRFYQRINSVVPRKNIFLTDLDRNSIFKKSQDSLLERKIAQYLRNRPNVETTLRLLLYRTGMIGRLNQLFIMTTTLSIIFVIISSKIGFFSYIYDLPIGILLSLISVYLILRYLNKRFKVKIMNQLPLAIEIILRGIKAGSSIEKTFIVVKKELQNPLKEEFSKILQQIEFGVPFEDAVHQAADRIDLSDFYFFSTALVIQRRAGGSLVEILENIITSLSRANELRSKVRVFSAEARVTAYILGALPIAIWLIMIKTNPNYLNFFRYEEMGRKMLTFAIGLILCAIWMIRYLLKI